MPGACAEQFCEELLECTGVAAGPPRRTGPC